jgi:hypothetical protein
MEVWDEDAVEAWLVVLDDIARVVLDEVVPIGLADKAPLVVRCIE